MGKKRILDVTCPYCGKRYNKLELESEGYVDELSVGIVITCPNMKCESQFILK